MSQNARGMKRVISYEEMGYYGEITVPQAVRSALGLAEGDDCLLTVIAN